MFGVLTLIIIGDATFDILSAITISYPQSVPISLNITLNQLYYFAQMSLAPLLYLFLLSMTNLVTTKYRKRIILSFLPFLLILVIWFANPITGHYFYFDSALNYSRGPLLPLLYFSLGYFLCLVVFILVLKRKDLQNNQIYSMLTFIFFSALMIVLQFFIPELLITGFAASMALVMTYLTLQNPAETLDDLTGVFNRNSLFQQIRQKRKLDGMQYFAVVSLDDFNDITKNIGIKDGNKFLCAFTESMKDFSKSSQIFKYSGDTFVVVFLNERQLEDFVSKMKKRLLLPWEVGNLELVMSASLYYSEGIPPIREEDYFSIILDQMLFKGKEIGSSLILPINQKEIFEILRMHHIEESLRVALENDKLDVYLQPVYCPKSDMFVSAEALVRFTDEKMGSIRLVDFLPMAEKNGMIVQIGRQVLGKVCKFIDENQLYKNSGIKRIMINLSVIEAVRTDLVSSVDDCLKKNNIPPGFLGFEITETNSSLGGNILTKNMLALKNRGFSFALDDFGTGYANLDCIIALPFNAVKLDSSMVVKGQEDEKMFIILSEHIQMFKRMGLRVIVEGVETDEHLELLKGLPVDLIQGYYYAKPMPLETAANFMIEYNKGKNDNEPNC